MVPNGVRVVLTIVFAVAACRSDAPTATGRPVALQRVSGDGQSGPPGESLERPLVARLVDAEGRPVRRVEVRWSSTAGDVMPPMSATDGNGEAKAVWKLGTEPGPQHATAMAEGLDPVEFVAFVDPNALPDRLPLRAIDLTTYDGSGQVVHPDVAFTLDGLDGQFRLAITPYPWGNANYENPSLFEGSGRDTWTEPAGLTNPVVKPPGGYLSDPDILWLADQRELWLYYRHVDDGNEVLLTQSTDGGVRWTAPRLVLRVPNHQAVSPTVVRRSPNDWLMWSVNSGATGCSSSTTTVELRRSTDGLTWSYPTTAMLSQPGVFPWHLEVQWIPARQEYWALYNGKVAGSCTTDALYIATSADGIAWKTYRSPILRRGAIPEFADVVYRATFAYDPQRDVMSLWHSGARFTNRGYEWHAAFERRPRAELFEDVARLEVTFAAPSTAPPLTNATAP